MSKKNQDYIIKCIRANVKQAKTSFDLIKIEKRLSLDIVEGVKHKMLSQDEANIVGHILSDEVRNKLKDFEGKFKLDDTPKESSPVFWYDKVAKELREMYIKKNADYGDSYNQSLDEDGLLVAKIRLSDKLSRFNSLLNNGRQVSDETIEDTLRDLANYAIMTVAWMEKKNG